MKYEAQFSKIELKSLFTETDGQKKYLHRVMKQRIINILTKQHKVKVLKGASGPKKMEENKSCHLLCE